MKTEFVEYLQYFQDKEFFFMYKILCLTEKSWFLHFLI